MDSELMKEAAQQLKSHNVRNHDGYPTGDGYFFGLTTGSETGF